MQDFTQYTVEDFAANDDFIAWSRGESHSVAWSDQAVKSEEMANKMAAAKKLVLAFGPENEDSEQETMEVWDRIEASIQTTKKEAKTRSLWRRIGAVAAAIGLLLLSLPFFNQNETFRTAAGEELSCTLPDRSTALIDDESVLKFGKKDWAQNRTVQLSGRAFFEVQKGSRFDVITDQGKVSVLGTSFSVESRDDAFRVQCKTGRVMVFANEEEVILDPGDGVELLADGSLQKEDQVSVDWISNTYRFSEVTLQRVFEEFERQFAVEVRLESGLGDQLFSGFFTDDDIDKALQDICWPKNLVWHREGNTIIVEQEASL